MQNSSEYLHSPMAQQQHESDAFLVRGFPSRKCSFEMNNNNSFMDELPHLSEFDLQKLLSIGLPQHNHTHHQHHNEAQQFGSTDFLAPLASEYHQLHPQQNQNVQFESVSGECGEFSQSGGQILSHLNLNLDQEELLNFPQHNLHNLQNQNRYLQDGIPAGGSGSLSVEAGSRQYQGLAAEEDSLALEFGEGALPGLGEQSSLNGQNEQSTRPPAALSSYSQGCVQEDDDNEEQRVEEESKRRNSPRVVEEAKVAAVYQPVQARFPASSVGSVLQQQQQQQVPLGRQKKAIAKNYDRNACRYLTRMAIGALNNCEYEEKAMQLAGQDRHLYEETAYFFERNKEKILGFRSLKEYIIPLVGDSPFEVRMKALFKSFLRWFMQERAVRHILNGKMKDKKTYIHYKNKVLLKFIERPQQWHSNSQNQK